MVGGRIGSSYAYPSPLGSQMGDSKVSCLTSLSVSPESVMPSRVDWRALLRLRVSSGKEIARPDWPNQPAVWRSGDLYCSAQNFARSYAVCDNDRTS